MANIGLQAVDSQHDPALVAQQRAEASGVGGGQRPQFVVAFQEVGNGALGHGHAACRQGAVDLGDGAVLGMAQASDEGEDIETELVVGQGEMGFGLGSVGAMEAWAVEVVAAANTQGEPPDAVEAGDRALLEVIGRHGLMADGTAAKNRSEELGAGGAGTRGTACHR